jgi:demethylmenaquinone methyltransferase/2-methoxy-6-polyprenyl-1,4-benzoquinol methylase
MDTYKHIAPYYNFLLKPFLQSIRRDVLKIVLGLKPGLVLDVACGTGEQLHALAAHNIKVIGIDLSEPMLRQCRQANPPATCLLQDGTAMAFQPASFDLVMISFALHETSWSAAVAMLDEMYRVLKPGGYLLVVDYADFNIIRGHVRLSIRTIEFLAGRRHYRNFHHYLKKGGLKALVDTNRFSLRKSHQHASGAIALRLYERLDVR